MQPSYLSTAFSTEYKLVLFGLGGVGKSAVTIQFIRGQFVEEYDPTIEDSYRKNLVIDNEPAELDILDTAGQEEYSSMRDQYIRNGQGFLLVYSIDSRQSFEEAKALYHQVLVVKDRPAVPIVLIGNKSDLEDKRTVSTSEGQELAIAWNVPFFETSAKSGINIDASFEELVRAVIRYRITKGVTPRTPMSAKFNTRSVGSFPGTASPNPNVAQPTPPKQEHEEEEVDLLKCCIIL